MLQSSTIQDPNVDIRQLDVAFTISKDFKRSLILMYILCDVTTIDSPLRRDLLKEEEDSKP